MKFQQKDVKGLSAEGYVHAITPYLENLESDLIKIEFVPRTEKSSGYFYAVVKVTLHLRYMGEDRSITGRELVISALGDGDSREVKDPAALVRNCETRAIKRACARALDLATKDINKVLNQPADVEEDEVGTSLEKEYNPQPRGSDMAAKIRESQKQVLEKLGEKRAAEAAAAEAGTVPNNGSAEEW
jgi:hypothetical protein